MFISVSASAVTQQSGSVGIEGKIPSNPPTQAATIDIPGNGQSFSTLPITVAGRCKTGLLVEIFKNNVFAGSVVCTNGSYSLKVDIFSGRNDLVARVYDDLNQAGPDSNTVSVTFNDGLPNTGPRVSLTSVYAKRGANPNANLSWPLTLSGGTGPYAVSVDWGDKSAPDLFSRQVAGDFDIQHVCGQSGIYNVTIKVTDANGSTAFLQVVAICNGSIQQSATTSGGAGNTTSKSAPGLVFWVVVGLFIPILLSSFWLGKQHQLQTIRDRLRHGERPL
ncbi:hypothetical protein COU91_01820 [Candidatus Saccharibacteria bacterium CG10_big_fil_rev_8_21_14_0_10_47_8]|nr:MAG: hypothetical protein COU91_01820 [Candidatus Saccharibacteria bacterium CG10_big_fil_rev_8_21_14_0_10_47_8]